MSVWKSPPLPPPPGRAGKVGDLHIPDPRLCYSKTSERTLPYLTWPKIVARGPLSSLRHYRPAFPPLLVNLLIGYMCLFKSTIQKINRRLYSNQKNSQPTPTGSKSNKVENRMPDISSYKLKPTRLIPNSPYPLIHYANYFADSTKWDAATIHQHFASNGWQTQWIYRYGPTQPSHYHSAAHECMAVLSGSATIRFGAADDDNKTHGDDDGGEPTGGIELRAKAGDVFLIPAGVSHKTFDPEPADTFALLTPGDGRGIAATTDAREALARVELSGFTMLGAYPRGSVWDFSEGGDHVGGYEEVWSVAKPRLDPVVGLGKEGMGGFWASK